MREANLLKLRANHALIKIPTACSFFCGGGQVGWPAEKTPLKAVLAARISHQSRELLAI